MNAFSPINSGMIGTEAPLQSLGTLPATAPVFSVHAQGVTVNLNWKMLVIAGVIGGTLFYFSRKNNLTSRFRRLNG